jgi:hypothetical protein
VRKHAIALAVATAAGLAGCGVEPGKPYVNDRQDPLKPGEGMFGDAATFYWQPRPNAESPANPMTAAEAEEFKKWRAEVGKAERQEFEDWKAWQEWKKQNPNSKK